MMCETHDSEHASPVGTVVTIAAGWIHTQSYANLQAIGYNMYILPQGQDEEGK